MTRYLVARRLALWPIFRLSLSLPLYSPFLFPSGEKGCVRLSLSLSLSFSVSIFILLGARGDKRHHQQKYCPRKRRGNFNASTVPAIHRLRFSQRRAGPSTGAGWVFAPAIVGDTTVGSSRIFSRISLSPPRRCRAPFLHPLASPPYFARHLLRVSLYFPLSLCFSLARKVS